MNKAPTEQQPKTYKLARVSYVRPGSGTWGPFYRIGFQDAEGEEWEKIISQHPSFPKVAAGIGLPVADWERVPEAKGNRVQLCIIEGKVAYINSLNASGRAEVGKTVPAVADKSAGVIEGEDLASLISRLSVDDQDLVYDLASRLVEGK